MPFLKQSTAQTIRFGPCLDKTDGVTEETALTLVQADMRLSKDGGAFAQKNATGNATHDSDGWYSTSLDATDTATVGELILNVHQPANMLPVWLRWWVLEEAIYDALFGAAAVGFDANQRVDVGSWLGTVVTASTAGRPDVNASAIGNVVEASNVLQGWMSSGGRGTADSGTTTTVVDATRTEADDIWNGCSIVFSTGALSGQCRLITDFDAVTDTITFAPATTVAVTTENYVIIPTGGVDVQSWLGLVTALVTPNSLIAGRIDADQGAKTGNVALSAQEKLDVNTEADTALTDYDAPTKAEMDTAHALLATPAQVNTEVVDVLKTDTVTLPGQGAPPLTPTFEEMVSWLYKVLRNRKTQTSTLWQLMADDETTVDAKATVSDDATTAVKQEIISGP